MHVPASITRGLVLRGVDVLTAQIDGTTELNDPDLLDRATELGRVLVSQDEDLLAEATKRQRSGKHLAGVIYAHQLDITIGKAIEDLEILPKPGRWKTSQIELSISRQLAHLTQSLTNRRLARLLPEPFHISHAALNLRVHLRLVVVVKAQRSVDLRE